MSTKESPRRPTRMVLWVTRPFAQTSTSAVLAVAIANRLGGQ